MALDASIVYAMHPRRGGLRGGHAADLVQQLPEEGREFADLDTLRIEVIIQHAMAAPRADGDARDG